MAVTINGTKIREDSKSVKFNLHGVFSGAMPGSVINIPNGNYVISTPLVLGAHDVTINGNGSTISVSKNFIGPVLDFSGVRRSLTTRLNIVNTNVSLAGILMGRTARGDSSGHTFRNCHVQGPFIIAAVYSFASEGCVFEGCNFVTHTSSPCYISTSVDDFGAIDTSGVSQSNTLGWFYNCSFRNYSGLEDVSLIRFLNTTSGFSIRDCYAYTGMNGTFVDVDGASQGLLLEAARIEGDGGKSLLLRNSGEAFFYQAEIRKINYTIGSDYLIESNHHLLECNFDFIHGCVAKRNIHMRGGGKLWRTRICGNKMDWITLDDGCQIRMCHLTWVGGEPILDVYDNIVSWTG